MSKYKVMSRLKFNGVMYNIGDTIELTNNEADGIRDILDKAESQKSTKIKANANGLYHLGFGKYKLSNGEVIQGKKDALMRVSELKKQEQLGQEHEAKAQSDADESDN